MLRENFTINLLLLCTSVAWLLFRMILLWRSYIFPLVAEVVPHWSLYISSLLKIVIAFSFNYLSTSLKGHHYFICLGTSYNGKQKKRNLHWQKKTSCFCQAAFEIHFHFQQSKTPSFKHTYFSLFIYRMSGDKELVWKVSCCRIISRLLKKTPKERKRGYCEKRKEAGRPNRGVSYAYFLFEMLTLTLM